jgi:hypothetical protein
MSAVKSEAEERARCTYQMAYQEYMQARNCYKLSSGALAVLADRVKRYEAIYERHICESVSEENIRPEIRPFPL